MKKLFLAGSLLLVAGCAGLIQTGSISKAYESYENEKYTKTLRLITQAESISDVTPELRAELTYLEARTYWQLGEKGKADTLFQYLKDQHKDSQYGYLAAERLTQR